jgi:hypothetical protein
VAQREPLGRPESSGHTSVLVEPVQLTGTGSPLTEPDNRRVGTGIPGTRRVRCPIEKMIDRTFAVQPHMHGKPGPTAVGFGPSH